MVDNESALLTFDQVLSEWLPISRSKLYAEIRSGRLRVIKLGRRSFICREDLEHYISRLRGDSAEPGLEHHPQGAAVVDGPRRLGAVPANSNAGSSPALARGARSASR